jgi:choline dehydrogenase-like flavoprotein
MITSMTNSWASITDWKKELEPWFDQARRMLGVTENPYFSNSDQAMKDVAHEMGVGPYLPNGTTWSFLWRRKRNRF